MSWKNLLYANYWFKQPVMATGNVYWFWLGLLVGLLAVGLAAAVALKSIGGTYKKVFSSLSSLGFSFGVVGLIIFFCRQENIVFFGWRIWFLVWAVFLAISVGRIACYVLRRLPAIKLEQADRAKREKYLGG